MTIDAGATDVIGVRAAARALGLNASTVSRYLKDHPDLNLGSETRPKVDVEELRRHRANNTNPAHRGSYAGRLVGEGNGFDAAPGSAQPIPDHTGAPPAYAASKAARESALADRARVDLDEKLGALLSRDEVEEACEEVGRLFQRELLDLAPRLAEEMLNKDDLEEIQRRLEFHFRALLEKCATELAGWA